MINPESFVNALQKNSINFVTGVPDSLLKDLCAKLSSELPHDKHIIAANEGAASALAIGHYLATSNPAMVYMQNSGLGNIINPLTSLADPQVYSIPMLLVIGWRGEICEDGSQLHDEPQHKKQGKITLRQLDILGIPYKIIDKDTTNLDEIISNILSEATSRSGPVAIIVRKGTFSEFKYETKNIQNYPLTREKAIEIIVNDLDKNIPIVCTTGVASRELFEIRKRNNEAHSCDFLTVGGMGYASSIAAGIANAKPEKKIVCIDGDGAALMHLGAMAINADCSNLVHFLINNEAHDSVGGQPTKGNLINFSDVAKTLGYSYVYEACSEESLKEICSSVLDKSGSILITVKTKAGFRTNLGRPDRTPINNKNDFMSMLGK